MFLYELAWAWCLLTAVETLRQLIFLICIYKVHLADKDPILGYYSPIFLISMQWEQKKVPDGDIVTQDRKGFSLLFYTRREKGWVNSGRWGSVEAYKAA